MEGWGDRLLMAAGLGCCTGSPPPPGLTTGIVHVHPFFFNIYFFIPFCTEFDPGVGGGQGGGWDLPNSFFLNSKIKVQSFMPL